VLPVSQRYQALFRDFVEWLERLDQNSDSTPTGKSYLKGLVIGYAVLKNSRLTKHHSPLTLGYNSRLYATAGNRTNELTVLVNR
jgi:hypothetical protein